MTRRGAAGEGGGDAAATPWVFCGRRHLRVARADAFEPPARLTPLDDLDDAVARALAAPLAAPPLRRLARGARSVVITVPDASRPCPTPAILPRLLAELTAAVLPDAAIAVAVGCGVHATTSDTEKARLVGPEAARRVLVYDAHGVESPLTDLGMTGGGAPVQLERRVAAADLLVTVGVVEPHLYAGFSGGVKGVAIGCAGAATIAWTHSPAFISAPGVSVGELAGNPFQQTLREIAARTRLTFAVNVVVGGGGRTTAVTAGEPVAAQAALADAHRAAWLRPVSGPFDVLVAGVPAPKSDNLYQASRAATYAGLAARPALAPGGLLLLCADLPDGAGAGPGERNFAVLTAAHTPRELMERGLREPLGVGGQRAYVVARLQQRCRLAVAGAADAAFLAPLGVAAFEDVAAALAAEDARLGRRARVLAVADAMATVVHAR